MLNFLNFSSMKQLLLSLLGLFWCSWSFGQSVSPEVIASAGEHFETATAQMSWTLGESVIETYEGSGSNMLTQGFHQTNLMIVAVDNPDDNFQVTVFPNPTTGMVNIAATELTVLQQLELTDANGRVLVLQSDLSPNHTLDLKGYTAGTYFLRLRAKDQNTIHTYKIIKLK